MFSKISAIFIIQKLSIYFVRYFSAEHSIYRTIRYWKNMVFWEMKKSCIIFFFWFHTKKISLEIDKVIKVCCLFFSLIIFCVFIRFFSLDWKINYGLNFIWDLMNNWCGMKYHSDCELQFDSRIFFRCCVGGKVIELLFF